MRKIPTVIVMAMVAASPALSALPEARISEHQARTTALALVRHGTIKSGELEREKGKLIYSFDITQPHVAGVEEVQISAITGKLVARHHESAAKEAAEARAESAHP